MYSVLLLSAWGGSRSIEIASEPSSSIQSSPKAANLSQTNDPVIAAAGDIACDLGGAEPNDATQTRETCHMKQTSDLLVGANLTAVLPLGDLQYSPHLSL
jgi:hypothetical protein